jgi:predicted phosphohydrolase
VKVFAIGDLHLSASGQKPMDVFGPQWQNHAARLARNWGRAVGADDVVLLCGDLSWAMTLEEAAPDLEFIDGLPGTKYFIRGNHDYWYSRPGLVRAAVGPSMRLVRYDAHVQGGVAVCGVRGWLWPGHPEYHEERDAKHWRRAIIRLGMSLEALAALEWQVAVAMFHHPPCGPSGGGELIRRIAEAGVRHCVYAHLHGEDLGTAPAGRVGGVELRCVSADNVDFTPALLLER